MPPNAQPPDPAYGPQYSQPEYAQPEYAQPEYAQPEYAQPEYAQPEYAQQQAYGPTEYAQPDFGQPDFGQPGYFQQEPPGHLRGPEPDSGPQRRITPLGWLGRGLALVAVSVVSGAVWLAVNSGSQSGEEQNAAPATKHQFASAMTVNGDQSCANVSEGKIKKFFLKHPCQHLTRALYTTTLPDGQKVVVSVMTVLMPDPNTAAQLNATATSDSTGNIKDLVDEKSPGTEHYPKLNDYGYASQTQGAMVAIGDANYFNKTVKDKDPQLVDVTNDALALASKQNQAQ